MPVADLLHSFFVPHSFPFPVTAIVVTHNSFKKEFDVKKDEDLYGFVNKVVAPIHQVNEPVNVMNLREIRFYRKKSDRKRKNSLVIYSKTRGFVFVDPDKKAKSF